MDCKIWRVGQEVKTPPFHGGITGSSPVHATKMPCSTSGLGRHPFKVVSRNAFVGSNPIHGSTKGDI